MIERKGFTDGMDFDSDESRMSPNSYRYALNIRNGNSERGAVGAITNAEGNQEVSVTLPSGANRVIGCYDDEPNDRVIYIVYNDNGDNRIFAYDYKNTVVKTIVSDSGNVLDLDDDFIITGIDVIEGEGTTYLLFTDNNGEPKNIDIEQGIRTYDTIQSGGEYVYRRLLGNFDSVSPTSVKTGYVYSRNIRYSANDGSSQDVTFYYRATAFTTQDPTPSLADPKPNSEWEICPAGYIYGNLTEESFTNIVAPPRDAPDTQYGTKDSAQNALYGNLYQFKARFLRADGRRSAWSPVSVFIDPKYVPDSLFALDAFSNANQLSNAIIVKVDIPDRTIYKTLELAVRRSQNDTSPNDWQLATKIDIVNDLDKYVYTDALQARYVFDGSNAPMPLDTNEATQLMSWVPKKAKTQAVTAKNRILYANFTEGQPITLDGVRGINQNPPQVNFYEEDNPFDTANDLLVYDYDGSTVGSQITEDTVFNPPIQSASGLAIEFPSAASVSREYTVQVECGFRLTYKRVSTSEENPRPHVRLSKTYSLKATSTAISTLLDDFVDAMNNDADFYVDEFALGMGFAGGGGYPINSYTLSTQSATSGGRFYLYLLPTASSTTENADYGSDYTVDFFPEIKEVPTAQEGTKVTTNQSFKRGTQQTFGIAYSDDYGRVSTVLNHANFNVANPWWRDDSISASTASGVAGNVYSAIGARFARLTLGHDAPSWASRFHILKTISNGLQNYVSFPLARITGLPTQSDGTANPINAKYFFRGYLRTDRSTEYSALTNTAASLAGGEILYLPLHSLQSTQFGYTSLNDAPLAYDFTRGDRIRLCYTKEPSAPADYYQPIADAEILFYSSELNAVAVRVNDLPASLTTGATAIFNKNNEAGTGGGSGQDAIEGVLCEIYTPVKEKTAEFYYEMYTGSVSADTANSRYYHVGNIQTQNSAQSAIVELRNGDCFLKPRNYIWAADDSDPVNSASAATYYVEEANYYDKVASKTWGAGRPNRVIRTTSLQEDITGFLGVVQRPTTIRYSEPLDVAQGQNGLGTIFDLNFKDANPTMKSIQHLHTEGDKTIIFHENAVGWAASDRAVITTLDGNNMTIGANTPLSDVVYYGTRAGIGLNPESFAFNNYRKYFVDVDQGQVCRLSMDGITVISDVGMNKYFKEVMRNMITSPEKDFAYGSYDKRTDEYTLSLKWNTEISAETYSGATSSDSGATIVFTVGSEAENTFAGDLVRVRIPEFSIGAPASYYQGFNGTMEVSAVASTTITVIVPDSYTATSAALFSDGEFTNPLYIYPYVNRTLTFSEKLGKWTSFHSFNPENHCSAGLDFVSFRAGKLYTHDDYANPMSYYGTDYNGYIDVVTAPEPDTVKVWNTASLKATTEDAEVDQDDFLVAVASADTTGAQEAVDGGVEDSRGKISTCTTPVYKEGQVFFSFMRTGTGTDYTGFIEGDHVRGYWARVRFKINSGISKIYKIMSVNFNYTKSNYSR